MKIAPILPHEQLRGRRARVCVLTLYCEVIMFGTYFGLFVDFITNIIGKPEPLDAEKLQARIDELVAEGNVTTLDLGIFK